MSRRRGIAGATGALVLLSLAACSSSAGGAPPGSISVVASTNVYGDIVEQLVGKLSGTKVVIASLIDDPSTDPHAYEASTRNQLAISRADLIIENGGGYDDFIDRLRESAGGDATVINAVDVSGRQQNDALNEHVWYDLPTVQKVADRVEQFLIAHDRADAATFRANATAFGAQLRKLQADEAAVRRLVSGNGVAITEPVPLYLLDACGLVNRTPAQFSRAVEEGTDVAPRVLQQTLALFSQHQVKALVYNEQTGGAATDKVVAAAKENNVATVPVTETLPAGKTYLTWMHDNLFAVAAALGAQIG